MKCRLHILRLLNQYLTQHGQHAVFWAYVQPGDALYVPAASIVLEALAGTAYGYKWHVVTPGPSTAMPLAGISAHMATMTKEPSSLPVVKAAKQFADRLAAELSNKDC
eukprot:6491803-Amphidinium_carterae.6